MKSPAPSPFAGVAPVLVFDLDGTLAETAGDLIASLNVILAMEDAPPVPVTDARTLVGHGGRALLSHGLARAGRSVDAARLEELFAAYLRYYEAHIADHSHLFHGASEALDRFAAAGWRLAVCTNKTEHPARKLLEMLGVADRFAAICGQDTFSVCKPDPAALLMTIDRAGGLPARSVMVGDSRTDIDTAKAAGVPVVAVDFGYTQTPVGELGPDAVVSHFDALWDAVGTVTRHWERAA